MGLPPIHPKSVRKTVKPDLWRSGRPSAPFRAGCDPAWFPRLAPSAGAVGSSLSLAGLPCMSTTSDSAKCRNPGAGRSNSIPEASRAPEPERPVVSARSSSARLHPASPGVFRACGSGRLLSRSRRPGARGSSEPPGARSGGGARPHPEEPASQRIRARKGAMARTANNPPPQSPAAGSKGLACARCPALPGGARPGWPSGDGSATPPAPPLPGPRPKLLTPVKRMRPSSISFSIGAHRAGNGVGNSANVAGTGRDSPFPASQAPLARPQRPFEAGIGRKHLAHKEDLVAPSGDGFPNQFFGPPAAVHLGVSTCVRPRSRPARSASMERVRSPAAFDHPGPWPITALPRP